MLDLADYFSKGEKWLYDELQSIKQDVFPDTFKLIIVHNQDQYNNESSAGIALGKLQELLTLLDFPNFFIQVQTANKNISWELETVKQLYCPNENTIDYLIIDGEFDRIIKKQDTLCILPWIHLYVNPQGQVGTCCEYDEKFPLGNLNDSNLEDIANSETMKIVRTQMIKGQRPNGCSKCWTKEDANVVSLRSEMNKKYLHHMNLVQRTRDDGYVDDFKLRYLDFRASNVCNLKCRMCGGKFSSRIAEEESKLYDQDQYIELKLSKDQIDSTLAFLESNIDSLEFVYFAGGEPLLIPEHYKILDLLIKHKRNDIAISYNTNLTTLKYKNINIINYWNQFSNISVGASIDVFGPQADYVRSGTDYDQIEQNYHAIKDYVKFSITSIVHILNVFNLPKLQKNWIEVINLDPRDISFQILITPEYLALQVLPNDYKKIVKETIDQHIGWLLTVMNTEHLVLTWQSVLQYMDLEDKSHLLNEFFRLNDDKDRYRKERLEDAIPELQNLRNYV